MTLTGRFPDYILVDFCPDLDLEFSRSNMEFALSQPKMGRLPKKSKHIDWFLAPECDHRIWYWPWPWPWIFKVKYGICYSYLSQNGPIATKRKANILFVLCGLNVTMRFYLGHDFHLTFARSYMKFTIFQPKMVRLRGNEKQTYRLNSSYQMQSLGFTFAMTLTLILDIQGQISIEPYLRNRGPFDIEKRVIHTHDRDFLQGCLVFCRSCPDSMLCLWRLRQQLGGLYGWFVAGACSVVSTLRTRNEKETRATHYQRDGWCKLFPMMFLMVDNFITFFRERRSWIFIMVITSVRVL